MSLYPTPTRIRLLRAVRDGLEHRNGHSHVDGRNRSAALADMYIAGWIDREREGWWRLTDAGRAVLDQAEAVAA